VALATGTLTALDPARSSDPAQQRNQQVQQDVNDLSDQQERIDEERRRTGNEVGWSNYRDSIGYSDVRPKGELPRIRIRP
jgi:hypothetical protein